MDKTASVMNKDQLMEKKRKEDALSALRDAIALVVAQKKMISKASGGGATKMLVEQDSAAGDGAPRVSKL